MLGVRMRSEICIIYLMEKLEILLKDIMNDEIKRFWLISTSVLIFLILFVPYQEVYCGLNNCTTVKTGFSFIGSLPLDSSINFSLLLIELVVFLLIIGSYYYLVIKNK